MIAYFNIAPYIFEKQSTAKPVTCFLTSAGLAPMLRRFVMRELQRYGTLDFQIFMQNESRHTLHIDTYITQLLRKHFRNKRNRRPKFSHFLNTSVTPDTNPYDFWLCGYLKNTVYEDNLKSLRNTGMRYTNICLTYLLKSYELLLGNTNIWFHLFTKNGGRRKHAL